MAVLKDHYYRLASELPEEQIKAATALVTELQQENSSEQWDYALNRLIKGLTSTKQSARVGFSMALIEVLVLLILSPEHELTISAYLDLLLNLTEVKSNMKGKEERAVLFGRLFGLQCMLNSGLLFEEKLSETRQLTHFCSCLVDLALTKPWIRESSFFTLSSFLVKFQELGRIDGQVLLSTFQAINDANLNLTTEGMSIYLSVPADLRSSYASAININEKSNWKNGDPLTRGNIQLLSKVLKEVDTNVDEENKPKQKGHWSPRVHFVWDLIIKDFTTINEETEKENVLKRSKHSSKQRKKQKTGNGAEISPQRLTVGEFWKVVVDESFFADKSSHERKYWGFEVFIKFLKAVSDSTDLVSLFTPNMLRCLINQSSLQGRLLHNISVQVLNSISEEATLNPDKSPVILKCLLDPSRGGTWNFDVVTKLKCVNDIISGSGAAESVKDVIILMFDEAKLLNSQETFDLEVAQKFTNDNLQKWCLDKLLLLVRSHKSSLASSSWLQGIFEYLISISFFKVAGVSINIRSTAQERLSSILSDVINLKTDKNEPWLLSCINRLQELEKSGEQDLITEFSQELLDAKNDILELLVEIKKASKKAAKKNQNTKIEELYCFQLLFSMVLIQLYSADEEAVSVLEELKLCYESTVSKEIDSDVDASQILTEIILSFVSKKSTLLKKLSTIIWESFLCVKGEDGKIKLSAESLGLLSDVLVARENKEGLQAVFEGQGEFVEEGESGDEAGDEDEEKDEEGDDDEDDDDDDDDDADSDDSDEDVVDDTNTENTDIDKATSAKLAEALGIPTESSGEVKFEDLSSDDEAESDSMDDEQMMQIDGQLSKIFKERRDTLAAVPSGNKRKAEVEEAKEQMIFFKYRILDLLESFTKLQPKSILNLDMIKPIVTLIGLTLDKGLGTKAHKLLKTRIGKTKIEPNEIEDISFTSQNLFETIEWLHTQARKSSNNAHSLACSQASLLLAKNLTTLDELYVENVIEIYSSSLKGWAKSTKDKTQASMFFDFINWLNSTRQKHSV